MNKSECFRGQSEQSGQGRTDAAVHLCTERRDPFELRHRRDAAGCRRQRTPVRTHLSLHQSFTPLHMLY